MKRKQLCEACKNSTAPEIWGIRITQCKVCGSWDISHFHFILALKMKELGFNWHEFAHKIDELEEQGTAKEQLFQ